MGARRHADSTVRSVRGAAAAVMLTVTASCTFAPPRHDPGLPGVPATSSDAMRDPFVAVALSTIRETLDGWAAALRREGPPLPRYYAPDAFLVQPGAGFVRGDSAIGAFEQALLTRANDGNLSLLDIEVSDGIAYVFGGYLFQPAVAGTSGSRGRHVTILRRESSARWLIRSQLFRADPPVVPFPGLTESQEPEILEVGTSVTGYSSRPAFFQTVTLLAAATRAWRENDARGLAGMFTPDALLLLPEQETPARGPTVRTVLDSALVRYGDLHTLELDFTASGRIAVLSGRHLLESSIGEDRHGFYTMVLVKRDSDWYVRALVID